jgi:hypothetical protein
VQITDSSGKVIEPNSGLIPFQLDDNLQATVTFHAARISTTGNAPAARRRATAPSSATTARPTSPGCR